VSIYYDPMLAKVVCHAPTRAEAVQQLVYNLRRLSIQGIATNREFLIRVLQHPKFNDGAFDTHFIDDHGDDVHGHTAAPELVRDAAIAATLAGHERRRDTRRILPGLEPGFRNNPNQDEQVEYSFGEDTVAVGYRNLGGGRFRCSVGEHEATVRVAARDGAVLTLEGDDGRRRSWRVVVVGDRCYVQCADGALTFVETARFPDASAAGVAGGCSAPMPGAVGKVLGSEGQAVEQGDTLLILEAMKMEHAIKAPETGTVRQLLVVEGEQVDADQLLLVVGASE
jgi:acetyl/propionyl-CoA carboxylase alpha subunit